MNWPLIAAGVFVAWAMVMSVLILRSDSIGPKTTIAKPINILELETAMKALGAMVLNCIAPFSSGQIEVARRVRDDEEYFDINMEVPGKRVELRISRNVYNLVRDHPEARSLIVMALAFRCMDREWEYVFNDREKAFTEAAEKQLTDAGIEITIINKEQ